MGIWLGWMHNRQSWLLFRPILFQLELNSNIFYVTCFFDCNSHLKSWQNKICHFYYIFSSRRQFFQNFNQNSGQKSSWPPVLFFKKFAVCFDLLKMDFQVRIKREKKPGLFNNESRQLLTLSKSKTFVK